MSALFSTGSLIALGLTLIFFVIALQRPRHAVLVYAVLGAAPPILQLGAFSGRTISQGLLLAEALGTALVAAWLANRPRGQIFRAPFDGPLMIFALSTVVSLIAAQALPDPVAEGNVSTAVSIGQVLLVLWPIGVYLASAELLAVSGLVGVLVRVVIALASLRLLHPLVRDEWGAYFAWMPTFSLFAAPFALAMMLQPRSWLTRLFLLVIVIIPVADGVTTGKTFLYGSVAVMAATVIWLHTSRILVVAAGLAAAIVLVGTFAGREQYLSQPLEDLVAKERSQASYGGRAGRGQLALDALSIWEQAPFVGVGPGNSYFYMLQRSPIGTPHNQYLNLLVEFGILGLAFWCWFLVVAFRTGLQILPTTTTPDHRMFVLGWLGMFSGMIAGGITGDFMIHSIRNGGLELFSGYYLQWVMLGGLVAVARLEQEPRLEAVAVDMPRRSPRQRRDRILVGRRAPAHS